MHGLGGTVGFDDAIDLWVRGGLGEIILADFAVIFGRALLDAVPQELHGQAHNNGDCTGNISYEQSLGGQPAGQLNIKYVVFDQGDVIKGLPTNFGGVLACSLKRINLSEDD